jgi:putative DeoR family transcriptional regulator (stage III sporulation protein D)
VKELYVYSIEERCVILARYLIDNKSTVRAVAKEFGVSKSTVHKDITQVLKNVDMSLYEQVKSVLEINKQERHIRGGEATRTKYINVRRNKSDCAK